MYNELTSQYGGIVVILGLQPTKTRAELDSSTVLNLIFETNILRVSPVKDSGHGRKMNYG